MPFRFMRLAMVPFLLALSGCLSKSGREHPDGLAAPDVDGDTDTDSHSDSDTDTDTDSGPVDADGDGWSLADGDCDDTDATVHPGAADTWYDGVDSDCSGNDDYDQDGDGYTSSDFGGADCEDADADVNPGAFELCDDVDQDCDGATDEACVACDGVVPRDHATIQEAIDAADSGAVVCVGPGTWLETLDFDGAEITLVGAAGAEQTTIDAECAEEPVVRFSAAEGPASVMRGFTLTGGCGADGAGILIEGGSPTLEDLVVAENELSDYRGRGGGIFIDGGAPTITRVRVTENRAYAGGFDGDGYGYGGGIYLLSSDAVLEDVFASGNEAGDFGGALALVESTAAIFSAWLDGNRGQFGGAGAWIDGGAPAFTNVVVSDNSSQSSWGSTAPCGAGLSVTGGASPRFSNMVIVGNLAEACGGGVYVEEGAAAVFVNVVVTDNEADNGGGISGDATLSFSDVWGNAPDDFDGTDPTGSDGNQSVDPMLHGYHLAADSPLVDAGDPALLDPDGSPSDMGAFGGPFADAWDLDGDGWASWWLPGGYDSATSPGFDCDDEDPTVYPGSGC